MKRTIVALIVALVAALCMAASASADQGNLFAADFVTGADFTDVNAIKGRVVEGTEGPACQGCNFRYQDGHISITALRIQTEGTEGEAGLIQAGWITSAGKPSYDVFGECIPAGTIIRGYFVEWRNQGIGQAYHCQYTPTPLPKPHKPDLFGNSFFEIVEPAGTWRVVKDGTNILTGLTLNFLQGKALAVGEYTQYFSGYGFPVACTTSSQFGKIGQGVVGDSVMVRHTGGSYVLVTAVHWVFTAPPPPSQRTWTPLFTNYGDSNFLSIYSQEAAGINGC